MLKLQGFQIANSRHGNPYLPDPVIQEGAVFLSFGGVRGGSYQNTVYNAARIPQIITEPIINAGLTLNQVVSISTKL